MKEEEQVNYTQKVFFNFMPNISITFEIIILQTFVASLLVS